MKKAISIVRGVVGITGILQLILGIVFWTGHLKQLIPVHMGIGIVFVLSLWTLAALGLRAGAPLGLAVAAWVWGLVIALLGMNQMSILPGPLHWIIKVTHLLTAMIGMGMAGAIQKRVGGPDLRSVPREADARGVDEAFAWNRRRGTR